MENLELTPGADHEYAVCLKSLFGEIYAMRQAALAAINLGQMEPFITRAVKTIQRIGTLSERVLIIEKANPSLKNSNQGPCLTCKKASLSTEEQIAAINGRTNKGEKCTK